MPEDLFEMYGREFQQEAFGALVAARVNDILSGNARALNIRPADGTSHTVAEKTLIFADTVARVVCANLIN